MVPTRTVNITNTTMLCSFQATVLSVVLKQKVELYSHPFTFNPTLLSASSQHVEQQLCGGYIVFSNTFQLKYLDSISWRRQLLGLYAYICNSNSILRLRKCKWKTLNGNLKLISTLKTQQCIKESKLINYTILHFLLTLTIYFWCIPLFACSFQHFCLCLVIQSETKHYVDSPIIRVIKVYLSNYLHECMAAHKCPEMMSGCPHKCL